MSIKALFPIAKIWKQHKCPLTDELINKIQNIHNEILFRLKKEEILLFMTMWMNLEDIKVSEITQS